MTRDELASWWRWFGESECREYSPLYEQISHAVANTPELLDRLLELPGHTQQPNMLLAAIHDRVLQGLAPKVAAAYHGGDSSHVGDDFVAEALAEWDTLVPTLLERRTQTNEIGRVAIIAAGLAALHFDTPPTLVDVGTSAGLTLSLDRCRIDYGSHGALGPVDTPVTVACEVLHGTPPIAPTAIAARMGFDRNPLDPRNSADFRWLLACTWPDTGRLDRTRAALELAAATRSQLVKGDAIDDLGPFLDTITGPLVITTTWVIAYLSPTQREAFSDVLAAASQHRPVTWISVEWPGHVKELPQREVPEVPGISASALGVVEYRDGAIAHSTLLAHTHPHGQWLWWYDAD